MVNEEAGRTHRQRAIRYVLGSLCLDSTSGFAVNLDVGRVCRHRQYVVHIVPQCLCPLFERHHQARCHMLLCSHLCHVYTSW